MTTRELQAKANGRGDAIAGMLAAAGVNLPVASIAPDPNQPRKTFDPVKLRELADNIDQHGLLHAIHVRECGDGRFMVITGGRRLAAFKLLGRTHIPAIVHTEPLSERRLRLLQVSENHLRDGVNAIEQALAFQECMGEGTASQLAQELGVAVSTIIRSLDLLTKLPPDIQDAVRQGKLPGSVAREITRAPGDDTKRQIAEAYLAGQLKTGSDVAAAVRAARSKGTAASAPSGFAWEAGGVRIRVELPAGQGIAQAEAVLKELVKDLHTHRRRSVSEFCRFLEAKARERQKAAEHQAAAAALAEHRPAEDGREPAAAPPQEEGGNRV